MHSYRLQLPDAYKKMLFWEMFACHCLFKFFLVPAYFRFNWKDLIASDQLCLSRSMVKGFILCVLSVRLGESREENMQEDGGGALTLSKRRQRRGPMASDALFDHFRWFIGWWRLSGDEVAKVQREVIAFLCVIKLQLGLMVLWLPRCRQYKWRGYPFNFKAVPFNWKLTVGEGVTFSCRTAKTLFIKF